MSLLILNIMIPLAKKNLTDYTWHLPDNYIIHVTIVAGKILLHGNNILLLYLFHILLYMYPDYTVNVVTIAITELSQWFR